MASRREIAFSSTGRPLSTQLVELLAEDVSGTYRIPFLCYLGGGAWRHAVSGEIVGAKVIGWRTTADVIPSPWAA